MRRNRQFSCRCWDCFNGVRNSSEVIPFGWSAIGAVSLCDSADAKAKGNCNRLQGFGSHRIESFSLYHRRIPAFTTLFGSSATEPDGRWVVRYPKLDSVREKRSSRRSGSSLQQSGSTGERPGFPPFHDSFDELPSSEVTSRGSEQDNEVGNRDVDRGDSLEGIVSIDSNVQGNFAGGIGTESLCTFDCIVGR